VRITHLWRYPVKSLGGEPLQATSLDHGGMPFDRSYRLVDELEGREGKPLTARQLPELLSFKATAAAGGVRVAQPDGAVIDAGDALATALRVRFDRPLRVEAVGAGAYPFFDDSDLLVINAASVRALGEEMSLPVTALRFRPSILLDGDDATPYIEDDWVGRSFAAGTAEIAITQRNIRCVFTNIDPDTCEVNPAVLRHIAERHEQCFGVYARVAKPGTISVGDEWRALT